MYQEINLNHLNHHKEKLLTFSNLTVYDIKALYKEPRDIDIMDCDSFEYDYNLPLYAKMIKRYQNNRSSPVQLHNQITPGYQNMLSGKYHLDKDVLDFFVHYINARLIYN